MTPAELGDLAEQMMFKAARLAAVVQDEGDARDVRNLIGHLGRTELLALAVDLAALVDLDRTVQETLHYLTWDEKGQPVRPQLPQCTVRELADRRLRVAS